jgi:hypothetical protein
MGDAPEPGFLAGRGPRYNTRMETITPTTAPATPASGRGLFFFGVALAVLPIATYAVQLQNHVLLVPWYLPIFTTLGALCLARAFLRQRSVIRFLGLALIGLLAGFEWFALISLMALPPYTGPLAVGKPFPAFETVRADGTKITQDDFHGDKDTLLVFFRGRW